MKTNTKINISICSIFILVFLFFSLGCGGGGGGGNSIDTADLVLISGKVLLPESNLDNRLSSSSVFSRKTTVFLEQAPTVFTTCDDEGNFKISVPRMGDYVNLIAFTGTVEKDDLFLVKSENILLSKDSSINLESSLLLEQGKNSFSIKLEDKYGNPISSGLCEFWCFTIKPDFDGFVRFPKLPESIEKLSVYIEAPGYKGFNYDYNIFTKDLGPVTIIHLRTLDSNNVPFVFSFNKVDCEPDTNQLVDLSLSIDDPYRRLPENPIILWECSDGVLLSSNNGIKNTWRAPLEPGLATISVSIIDIDGFVTKQSIAFAVGKSREPYTKIIDFTPEKGKAGEKVYVSGRGFGSKMGDVLFVDASAEILKWSDDKIEVILPDEAKTGKIIVNCDKKSIVSEKDFTVHYYVTKVDCKFGVPGTVITLTGYGFGDSQKENSYIAYNDEKIENIISWTNRHIKFKIPELVGGAPHTSNLELFVNGEKRYSDKFTVSYIKKISPEEASRYTYETEIKKTEITIYGDGFGNDDSKSSVKFLVYGDKNSKEYIDSEVISWSENEIVVELPSKAQTGNIILNINGYELLGPKLTIIPPKGYSEQIDSRFSDVILDKTPLITGVIPVSQDKVYLCDPSNKRLWYVDGEQISFIQTADAVNIYSPYTGCIAFDGSLVVTDSSERKLIRIKNNSIVAKSDYVFRNIPKGLYISKTTGNIYASDSGANQVVVFDQNLVVIDSFGSSGIGNGIFDSPSGICMNSDETSIFVADTENHRIQKFNISTDIGGRKQYVFNCWYGSFNGVNGKHTSENEFGEESDSAIGFMSPSSVACDGSYIYIADTQRNDIQKINTDTLACQVIGEDGSGNSQFLAPSDIKLLGSNFYVADSENSRIQVISKTGEFIAYSKPDLSDLHQIFLGVSMNSDKDSLYLVDSDGCCISKYDVYGNYEKSIGSKGSAVGQLLNPSDVLLDKYNNIWVADTDNRRLVKFPADGGEVKCYGTGGSGVGQFKSPQRLACDSKGNIFVSDCDNNWVLKFDNSGKYLYSIGQAELKQPFGLAVDSEDNLYVGDAGNHRICKYDSNNQFEGWFGLGKGQEAGGWHDADETAVGNSGSAPCEFDAPTYLDIDSSDNLYVLDSLSRKIQKLNTKNIGILGGHICTISIDTDIFGLAVDDKDCIFVTTDSYVRKYVPTP